MQTLNRLNHIVADMTVLAQKTRLCHWNVEGPGFLDYHEFFGELYDFFSDEVDEFAERVRALNAYPVATYTKMLEISHFKEEENIPSNKMVAVLLQDIETMANEIRSWIPDEDDAITQDMYIGLVTTLDKKVWILRAMTQPGVQ